MPTYSLRNCMKDQDFQLAAESVNEWRATLAENRPPPMRRFRSTAVSFADYGPTQTGAAPVVPALNADAARLRMNTAPDSAVPMAFGGPRPQPSAATLEAPMSPGGTLRAVGAVAKEFTRIASRSIRRPPKPSAAAASDGAAPTAAAPNVRQSFHSADTFSEMSVSSPTRETFAHDFMAATSPAVLELPMPVTTPVPVEERNPAPQRPGLQRTVSKNAVGIMGQLFAGISAAAAAAERAVTTGTPISSPVSSPSQSGPQSNSPSRTGSNYRTGSLTPTPTSPTVSSCLPARGKSPAPYGSSGSAFEAIDAPPSLTVRPLHESGKRVAPERPHGDSPEAANRRSSTTQRAGSPLPLVGDHSAPLARELVSPPEYIEPLQPPQPRSTPGGSRSTSPIPREMTRSQSAFEPDSSVPKTLEAPQFHSEGPRISPRKASLSPLILAAGQASHPQRRLSSHAGSPAVAEPSLPGSASEW
eukprot:TRINITY_DN403_c0_g1_i1.p1 TRINITY_DN403_c0_g1~~TRINITY_DN403_c0_g1_i1.p1  ORF type:complete len:473 (-),score=83.29 TRINITY_DN403_c0_g1_i1:1454-2872(-)